MNELIELNEDKHTEPLAMIAGSIETINDFGGDTDLLNDMSIDIAIELLGLLKALPLYRIEEIMRIMKNLIDTRKSKLENTLFINDTFLEEYKEWTRQD